MGRQSYFITHLVNMFNVDDVIRRNNTFIKKRYFDRVIDKILENILGYWFVWFIDAQGYVAPAGMIIDWWLLIIDWEIIRNLWKSRRHNGSIIKVFGLLFGFVFDLNKNLTLKKDNLFSFSSLNRFFALSLHKISCISAKQSSKLVDSALDLHYLWIR